MILESLDLRVYPTEFGSRRFLVSERVVAPQIVARFGERWVRMEVFPRSSASETAALQALWVDCPRCH
jgi:hypothetical protein